MKTPLIGHSHFILFFRPICWLSHPLSPCPQHEEARHGRKASCAARQLQPASASFSSLAVQRVTPTPGTPGLLPEPVLRFPNGTWLWHLPSPRQLPRASTAGRAAQRGRSRPDAGTRGDRVGRGKQGKSQGGGEQPPCPAAGPPPGTNAACRRGGGFAGKAGAQQLALEMPPLNPNRDLLHAPQRVEVNSACFDA